MVIVIGGGITGLSLAYFLNLKGHEVVVIEKEPQLGGNCSWTKLGEFTVGIFYHVITGRDTHILNWIQELGIRDKLFPIKARMGFYQGGGLYPISTPKELLTFPLFSLIERIRFAISIIRSKAIKNWKELDGVTAAEWLSRIGGESIYKKLWRPVMINKFGPLTDEVVATDMWFRINRTAGIRNKRLQESVYSISGSTKTFFDALEKKLTDMGVKILKGTEAVKINVLNNRVKEVVLSNQNEMACDSVISAIPIPYFIDLLPDIYSQYTEKLRLIKYLNNICLILRLKERFSPYYQLNLGEDDLPFTGIIGADALYPPRDFKDSYILCISKYFSGESKLWNMDAESILKYYIPYLKNICPEFKNDWVLDITLTKKKNVETIHSVHYSQLIPSFKTPIINLYLLCTAQIYPEPTVLDASVKYAEMLVNSYFNGNEK